MNILENKILEGITILDFSHRLPGPMAGLLLAQLGAKVIKIEDEKFGDAFEKGLFADFDPDCFRSWYKSLNEGKTLLKLNFKDTESSKKKIAELLAHADGIIQGLPPKLQVSLGLSLDDLEKSNHPLAIIEMGACLEGDESMHDLNAMALSGLLELHTCQAKEDIVDPPFLPVSGVAFAQKMAADLLGLILKSQKENKTFSSKAYLFETCRDFLGALWPKDLRQQRKTKFLHNGAFPCYGLYRTKDAKYVALAAVEEKFWISFSKLFGVNLGAENRFDKSPDSFQKVSAVFKNKSADEIAHLIKGHDVCVTLLTGPQ